MADDYGMRFLRCELNGAQNRSWPSSVRRTTSRARVPRRPKVADTRLSASRHAGAGRNDHGGMTPRATGRLREPREENVRLRKPVNPMQLASDHRPAHLVFLPATADDDPRYGTIPTQLEGYPDASILRVRYPSMVWYNRAVRAEAIDQIRSWRVAPLVLIGFSKSGLGAWNIARAIPERVAATIIFDGPVARQVLPPWGAAPFYADDAAWQRDLPLNTLAEFQAAVPAPHRLVLISGRSFHQEMETLSLALGSAAVQHTFLPRPTMEHHWNAGWIEEGLNRLPPVMLDRQPRAG